MRSRPKKRLPKFTHLEPHETGLDPVMHNKVHRVIIGEKQFFISNRQTPPIIGAGYVGSIGTMELIPIGHKSLGNEGLQVMRFVESEHRGWE